jgi:hypothetical protein
LIVVQHPAIENREMFSDEIQEKTSLTKKKCNSYCCKWHVKKIQFTSIVALGGIS